MHPVLVVCMGVSGAGKSTYAEVLSKNLGLPLLDADDFHSESNKQKMQSGIPLSDEDRGPWMQEICKKINAYKEGKGCVIAHSALRYKHRKLLRNCGLKSYFLHFCAPKNIIEKRLSTRRNHFMPSELLDSQFASLEPTSNEFDVIEIDASQNVDRLTESVCRHADAIQKEMNEQKMTHRNV